MGDFKIRDQNGKIIGVASGDPAWVRTQLAEMQGNEQVDTTARVIPDLRLVPPTTPAAHSPAAGRATALPPDES